jgi:hypothetical protein
MNMQSKYQTALQAYLAAALENCRKGWVRTSRKRAGGEKADLCDRLGALGDGVLGEFTRKDESY